MPNLPELGEIRRFYAAMLAERDGTGDRERARELLEGAFETYQSVGMPRHIEIVESMLKEL